MKPKNEMSHDMQPLGLVEDNQIQDELILPIEVVIVYLY